jgi:hypothetical protein
MKTVFKAFWMAAGVVLLGLWTGCQSDDASPVVVKSAAESAREAEAVLLAQLPINRGAVVSFVGPVPLGSVLAEQGTTRLTVPLDIPGSYYLFFVNDYPDQRYNHPVRYACVNPYLSLIEAAAGNYYPHLVTIASDSDRVFERIQTDTVAGVIFYYGRGGNAGFPAAYLQ